MTPRLPPRTLQKGASAALALVAAAVLLGVVNYFGARHFRRWDWTSSRLYTLSEKTKQVLAEAARGGRSVTATALLTPSFELYDSVRELLASYASQAPFLKVEFLDPAREPARAEALIKKFGLQSESELRFVVFESDDRSKQVDLMEIVEYDTSGAMMGGPPKVKAFKGEQAFTGAILSVTQSRQSAICFSRGHGEPPAEGGGESGFGELTRVLKSENFRITEWDSLGLGAVPAECEALVLGGPRQPFLAQEAAAIGDYLRKGGRLLAMLDPEFTREGTIRPTGLEPLLREFGAEIGGDLIVDRGDRSIILLGAGPETLILRDLPGHPVTRNLGGAAVMLPIARSVSAVSPAPTGLTVEPIARTSADGWAERDLSTLQTGISKGPEDLPGPVTVGLAIERNAPGQAAGEAAGAGSDRPSDGTLSSEPGAAPGAAPGATPGTTPGPETRLVIFGDSDFAANGVVSRLGNLDLALNTIHWLAEKDALIGIEPRTPEQVVLTLDPSESRNLGLFILLGLPALAAISGVAVWWIRRS